MNRCISRSITILTTFLLLFLSFTPHQAAAHQQLFSIEDGMNIRGIGVDALTPDGRYAIARTTTRHDRFGVNHNRFMDPTYIQKSTATVLLIDTENGDQRELFDEPVQTRSITWSPDGSTLAFFQVKDQRMYLQIYDRGADNLQQVDLQTDKEIASNSTLEWRPDGSGLLLQLRDTGWREKADSMYKSVDQGPIVIQDSNNDHLAWERVSLMNGESILTVADPNSGEVTELTEPDVRISDLNQAEDGSFITFVRRYPMKTDYAREGDSEFELIRLAMDGTARMDTLVSRSDEDPDPDWNHAGDAWAWSDGGKVFVRQVGEEDSVEITADYDEKVEDGDTTRVRYSVREWHPQDESLLLGSEEGYHLAGLNGESMELVYETSDDDDAPQRSITHWSSDARYLYMTYSARDRWERGLTRYDLEERQMEPLMVDSNLYSSWDFAESGDRILFEQSDGDRPAELYVAGPELENPRQLTDLNPWMEDRVVSRSELVRYMDVDGDTLYGVLNYPANYEEGQRYPLIANVYEQFFSNGFSPFRNILAAEGYFVFRPSVDLEEGYPGEAWLKGVTTGINKLMEQGLVDGTKLGVQGTSYGGYAVNLLITQTDRFAAAVNNSGKVNMVSFLGDSPKITTRNYDAAEVGQDRIGETLWEAQDKYIAHSAIFFADRIETPLLILSGEGDWNVPATNQREMYYALRRLGKDVKWVHYMEGGHGAGRAGREEDYIHHWNTVLDFYQEKFYPEEDEEEGPVTRVGQEE